MLDRIFKLSAPLQKSYVVIDEAFTPSGTQNRALDAVRPFRSKVDL